MPKISKICLSFAFVLFSFGFAAGQDLGNSGGLLGSPKKSKPTTTIMTPAKKTTAVKPKTSASTVKKTTIASTKKTSVPVKKQTVSKNRQQTTRQTDAPTSVSITKPEAEVYDERFEDAIDEGNVARDERNYARAESAYRRAQSIRSDDSRAIYGLGNLYSDQQRWDEAEKSYREAIRIEPASPYAYIALSYVLVQPIFGSDLLDRYTEAEKLVRRAIQLDSQNPYAYDQLGVALESRGLVTQETENAYRKAIQIDPASALAYAHLGRLLRKKSLINQSTEAYGKAIQLSTDVPTMILVAEVMQSQQRYTDSEQLLRGALRQDPKNPTALFLLGRALTTRASYDEAQKVLKKSLEVSPNNFIGYVLLGSLYTRQGDLAEAEKNLFKALQVVSPSEKKLLAQEFETIGDAWMRVGKKRDAVRVYQQAAALDAQKTALADKLSRAQGGD
ncbi:MAG TPA: tetratricopeptide repeat protein [Pyrinomonadaceae bacterium]